MGGLGYGEMVMFGIVALLLFGARLPEVARTLGGSYRELKKSVGEFQKEFTAIERYEPPKAKSTAVTPEETRETSAPKFTPPPSDDE
jgi:sec-independent protein translocase protein TatA